ncbi:uncharacterized protein EAE97_005384 [Botrytis byssoidea]|uniref:Uncharacterized protein n=1 Tax=Botrytis byssoidea TaxID=139641 RepID=A0A9P5IQ37_9HELO|nr:uncharacterized protein EAE97_005384 [Botrytis byssoidea]KAF7944751.1 hypothetical protein EAE97_005384 [Botrytis byssoidea]
MPRRRPYIAGDFDRYFGNVSDLRNWQQLCADVKIPGAWHLRSINACRKVGLIVVFVVWEEKMGCDWDWSWDFALANVHVNICQLLESYQTGVPVRIFPDRDRLLAYTIEKRMFYPLSEAKRGGPVRGLLFKRG